MKDDIELGNKVKDVVTGFEGIALTKIENLTGSILYEVIPDKTKSGEFPSSQHINAARLKKIDGGVHVEKVKSIMGFHARGKRND